MENAVYFVEFSQKKNLFLNVIIYQGVKMLIYKNQTLF